MDTNVQSRRFTFALSFAGSDRKLAREIRDLLKAEGFSVFFDEDYEHELIGRDASLYLRDVYTRNSRFCIVLISRQYDRRQWTQLERESIQSRELTGERGILIPVRLEDYAPEWLPATRIYFDLTDRPVAKLISVLKKKAACEDETQEFDGGHVERSQKEAFVRAVCFIVKSNPTGDAMWAKMLFPEKIGILISDTTPLSALVDRAKEMDEIDASFETTVARLKRDWDHFAPGPKRRFIDEIRKYGLSTVFSGLLFLRDEEEAYLRIAWAVADAKYDKEKVAAFEQCKSLGVDLQGHELKLRHRMDYTLENVTRILGDLVHTRVRIDLDQVLVGAGRVETSYAREVAGRAQSEYLDLLRDFRQCLDSHGFSGNYTEECLDPFKRRAEAICSSPIAPGLLG
jgi:hypothetical protein